MNGLLFLFLYITLVVLGGFVAQYFFFKKRNVSYKTQNLSLVRSVKNPVLGPSPDISWESNAVFNPGAWYDGQRVHLVYRALGNDGISRIGYAVSDDGIHFIKSQTPAFVMRSPVPGRFKNPFTGGHYDRDLFASGGGWGGSEDPRIVTIEGRTYMTFGVFESWDSLRMAITSIDETDFKANNWNWAPHFFVSPANETNKNWVLFPEKIRGKFALLHALTPDILIDYADTPDLWHAKPIKSNNRRGGRIGHWDAFVRGAAAPPVKTKYGWLLLYHGMNPAQGAGYNVGAMLLDLGDPTKILYRSEAPILEPKEWYENDWKPGVVYASGAVVKDGTLFVYYGGGDKWVNVATAPLEQFLEALMQKKSPVLTQAL